MTLEMQYQITEEDIDVNGTANNLRVVNYTFEYEQAVAYQASMPSADSFISFPFGTITSGSFIRITTDKTISIKLNGGSEIFTITSNLLINGTFTGLVVKNVSGHVATVNFEVYGS